MHDGLNDLGASFTSAGETGNHHSSTSTMAGWVLGFFKLSESFDPNGMLVSNLSIFFSFLFWDVIQFVIACRYYYTLSFVFSESKPRTAGTWAITLGNYSLFYI